MIALHVTLTAKAGKKAELETAISEKWLPTMAEQPGFLRSALLKPVYEEEFARICGTTAEHEFEVVAFWESTKHVLSWAKSEVHDDAFAPVLKAGDTFVSALGSVARTLRM